MFRFHGVWSLRLGCLLAGVALALSGVPGVASGLYKCTTASGGVIYSDRPCGDVGASGDSVVSQQSLEPPPDGTAVPDAAALSQRCTTPRGKPIAINDALESLPEAQRLALMGILKGMGLGGLKREDFDAIRAHLDTRGTLMLCRPVDDGWIAHRVESNGQVFTLSRSGRVTVHNDANDPITLAGRCGDLVTACFRPGVAGHSMDQCFADAPACPTGKLAADARCCPQGCKDAYRQRREAGGDPLTTSTEVLFPRKGPEQSCTRTRH